MRLSQLFIFFCRCLTFAALLLPSVPTHAAGVDLHAHLFMKSGLGPLFSGEFNDPLKAENWKSRFQSQINSEAVIRSGLDIIVVSLYAHPFLVWDRRNSIRRQLSQAADFVRQNPGWIIAKDPTSARKALSQKKQVLILSLEGASGILETDADIREFVEEGGIRIVTFFHLTDDSLGGAALLNGLRGIASPWALLKSMISGKTGTYGEYLNTGGITDTGLALFKKLLSRKVWIDLAHAPDLAWPVVLPILELSKQPLLVTHTSIREHLPMERTLSWPQVDFIAKSGGILGLMPSEEMLGKNSQSIQCLPDTSKNRPSPSSFIMQFLTLSSKLGDGHVMLGSDFNGGIYHLSPESVACSASFEEKGYWNLGQSAEVLRTIEKFSGYSVNSSKMAESFLNAWETAFNGSTSTQ
ncbi:MAG: membrane dipeptidase [Bdellovibrio sp.]|nr:membrane dipeptidase [Bdellovibrio sp.]